MNRTFGHWVVLVLVLVSGAGCHHPDRAERTGSGTGSAAGTGTGTGTAAGSGSAGSDPWAAKAPKDGGTKAPETEEARKARAEAALGRVASIEPKLAKIRGLAFEHDVPTEYQTTADFRTYLEKEIQKELPPAKAKDLSAAYAHLGLFKKQIDLAAVLEQTMATQAGAYYDPAAKKFFLVMVPDSDLMLDTMSAHELTHALQDQHFDLQKYLEPPKKKLDDDESSARRFVVEGDATFSMLVYTLLQATKKDAIPPGMVKLIKTEVEQFAGQDLAAFTEATKKQGALFGAMDPEIKKSIDAMADLPPAVLVPLVASYTKGALVAMVAYQHGGWAGVDALFRNPPESTEQVLHPETKLYPRDHPHHVTLGKAAGTEVASDTLGEMMWWVYFHLWTPSLADTASQGWGGDRYRVVRSPDGRLVGTIATVWDTPADAKEFADAYQASVAARFPGAPAHDGGITRPDGGDVLVRVAGTRVYIVDGGDRAALDDLVRTAKLD